MNLFRRKSVTQLQADALTDDRLKRALGATNLTALGIGAIIGTGIFVLTGTVAAQNAGPAVVLSFVLAGVASIFAELRNEFAGPAATKGLDLTIEPSTECVYSDPSLVEQILRNLLSNAIKYTRTGRVLLHCRHEGPRVRIEVLDTGIGIPADQIPYIYDEFYQVGVPTNSTRSFATV